MLIRARTADYMVDMPEAEFMTIVETPTDVSPVDIPSTLPEGRYSELEVHLYNTEGDTTPAVGKIGFSYECTTELEIE